MKQFVIRNSIRLLCAISNLFESMHLGIYWKLIRFASDLNELIASTENQNALVHIHMTTYNVEETIQQAIESIVQQTHENWQLIIIDDCSTDQSVDIIKSFNDPRIEVICNSQNKRQWHNRNIAMASGLSKRPRPKFYTLLDGDDIAKDHWLKNSLSLFTSSSVIGIRPKIFKVHFETLRPLWPAPACCQTMWRAEVILNLGGYNTELMAADSDFMNRARRLAGINRQQILVSTETLQLMRDQPKSWSKKYTLKDELFKDYSLAAKDDLYFPLESRISFNEISEIKEN